MGFKTDKEYEERGDIVILSEIITISIYWQEYQNPEFRQIWGNFRAYLKFDRI